MFRLMLGIVAALVFLTACATPAPAGPKIKTEKAWARPAAASTMTHSGMQGSETTAAAYFVIVNEGSESDTLIGVSTEAASKAETHETRMEGDVAKMMPVPRVEVPAGRRVEFKPVGLHVMLIGLSRDLKEGETFSLTLKFEKSGIITIQVPIREVK